MTDSLLIECPICGETEIVVTKAQGHDFKTDHSHSRTGVVFKSSGADDDLPDY